MRAVFGLTYQRALLVCVFLAQNDDGDYYSSEVIGSTLGISKTYVAKLARLLSTKGILMGLKGHNGGYRLACSAQSINLFEIFTAISNLLSEDQMAILKLGQGRTLNWNFLRPAARAFRGKLESISLARFAGMNRT